MKEVEELMFPPYGVKQNLDRVVDSTPSDQVCEVHDGELTHE